MPTAAKLVAAFWFAIVAWFAAELVKPYLPEAMPVGIMSYLSGAIGAMTGWIFLGRRAGDTMTAAYTYGFTASVILSFWCVFYFAFEQMIKRSLDKRYDGATEAIMGMIDLMREYALHMAKVDVILVLLIGGVFGGWLTEKAARRWA